MPRIAGGRCPVFNDLTSLRRGEFAPFLLQLVIGFTAIISVLAVLALLLLWAAVARRR